MGRPFSFPVPQRSLSYLRYRLALVLVGFILFEQHHLFFKYQEALAAKYSPTKFPPLTEQQSWAFDEESVHYQDQLVANRAAWRPLREGWEGKTFIYQGSVIKTFTPGRSPFRNCAPGTANELWPTELPASLYFGGSGQSNASSHDGFLPVKALFMTASSNTQAEWHLVTPLAKGGSLQDLTIKMRERKQTYRDIDGQYRSAFTGLLDSLQVLHGAGYCHDDVKPGNILIADDAHWILGDLGNLRHVTHPYHTSLLWKENKQLPDCRKNDVFRALKSYVQFVRAAAVDAGTFDAEFYEKREPLSRLFWSVAVGVAHFDVEELRARAAAIGNPWVDDIDTVHNAALAATQNFAWLNMFSRRSALHFAVNQELQTRLGEKTARWWALTWFFGVQVTITCGV
ncbi:hypothetical protein SVAN01_02836 [Stagonosporopsis vannaccii]|nr:hypothetical protein SVAN01_02836 [Stagonosporopsis vannaccii]